MPDSEQVIIPFYPLTASWEIEIDGVTYTPAAVDSTGRLLVRMTASDGGTQVQAKADADGRLIVSQDVGGADLRLANENHSTAQTNNELVGAPGAGKNLSVTGIIFSTDAAMNVSLTQSTGSPATPWGPHYFAANTGLVAVGGGVLFTLAANAALRFTSSAAGNHTITVFGKVV